MIQAHFEMAGDQVAIIVDGNNLMFSDDSGSITTIEGLKLDYSGVVKEHPDLKDDEDWNKKAKERLKEHVKKFKTDMERINYIKDELVKFRYSPLFFRRDGWRPEKFK